MGRLLTVALMTLLLDAEMNSAVPAACPRNPDVSTARARWATTREKIDFVRNEDKCRVSSGLFWEAVNVRQVVSNCEEGTDHQRDLDGLDAEINALNEMIDVQCSH